MPLLTLDATDPDAPHRAAEAAAALPRGAPVVALIHGFRYAPALPGRCPSETLYAANGWPARLGFSADPASGLAIGFGWNARGSIWRAWAAAARTGGALSRVMAAVADTGAGPVDVVAHSLGARAALAAAGLAPPGAAGRLILLAAAAFRGEAQAVLSTPGGRAVEVVNVTSRENDLFDLMLAACLPGAAGPALGAGLGEWRRNWIDLGIDDAGVRAALTTLGFPIPGPARAVCHWSGYQRPGLFAFYAALLRHRAELPLALIGSLLPDDAAPRPRRSRLALPAFGRRAT